MIIFIHLGNAKKIWQNDSRNSNIFASAASLGAFSMLVYFPNCLKLVNLILATYKFCTLVASQPWLRALSEKFSEFRVFRLA